MAGRWELGLPNTDASSLRAQAARKILRCVRSQGHIYVELRGDGKKFIFFCTLCLSPCYSDSVLFDHLKGNLHNQRLSAARITLLMENPWPFNDGIVFFDNSRDDDNQLVLTDCDRTIMLSKSHYQDDNLAIVKYGEGLNGKESVCSGSNSVQCNNGKDRELVTAESASKLKSAGQIMTCNSEFVIPRVLIGEEVSNLKVRGIGLGKIAARFLEKGTVLKGISRIWCEWLGKENLHRESDLVNQKHDFAVVVFSYHCDLGRRGLHDDMKLLRSSNSVEESDNEEGSKKRKKSFSDPEDSSVAFGKQYDSSGEDSSYSSNINIRMVTCQDSSSSNDTSSGLLLDQFDNQLIDGRFISNKAIQKALRRQQRIAAEKTCDICQQKMLPGKDVATLLNLKTGRLACSSRNGNGAFHVFHLSCLIHWILWCEFDIITNHSDSPRGQRRSKRKKGTSNSGIRKNIEPKATRKPMKSVFCPACQGTGMHNEGDENELEKITYPLSEIFKIKIKVSDARRSWMKSPEVLNNCSIGFHFSSQSEEAVQEKVKPIKLLQFYQAEV